jgi:hypothetical protein
MKLIIDGVGEYDIQTILEEASLNDLFYLKVKTKTEEFPAGVSMKTLGEGMKKWGEFEDPSDILDDAEALLNLRSLVYLARRHSGEKVSVDEANNFPLRAFRFEVEDGDEVEPADPQKALPASGQGDAAPAKAATTSTTSRRRSTSGSRSSRTSGQG